MVNKALVLENHRGIMERKRKQECQGQGSGNSKNRVSTPFVGLTTCLVQQSPRAQFQQRTQIAMHGYQIPQRQFIQRPNAFQTTNPGGQNVQR
jgi:hypothetical protein